ncbi:Ras protein [Pelomyxa schiedti]|nr:Ras protein [Pelomyxa schiedti]
MNWQTLVTEDQPQQLEGKVVVVVWQVSVAETDEMQDDYYGDPAAEVIDKLRRGMLLRWDCGTKSTSCMTALLAAVAGHIDTLSHNSVSFTGLGFPDQHIPSIRAHFGISEGYSSAEVMAALLHHRVNFEFPQRKSFGTLSFGPASSKVFSSCLSHFNSGWVSSGTKVPVGESHCLHCNHCRSGYSPGCYIPTFTDITLSITPSNFEDGLSCLCGHILGKLELAEESNSKSLSPSIARALAPHLQHLTDFRMQFSLPPQSLAVLAPHIAVSASLQRLDFAECGLNCECAQLLANALRDNTSLQNVNLNTNPLGDIGARALAQACCCRPPLKLLSLVNCNIREDGGLSLASISDGHRPESLMLDSNIIGEAALHKLGVAFGVSPVQFCASDPIKIVCVGSGGIGTKSATIIQYVQGIFVTEYDPTIEDSYRRQVTVDGVQVLLDILDTVKLAKKSVFSAMRPQYMRRGEVFSLGYSITCTCSFQEVQIFHEQLTRVKGTPDYPKILIGGKCDLERERKVSRAEGEELAKQIRCPFFESSACTRVNVTESFEEMVRVALKARYSRMCGAAQLSLPTIAPPSSAPQLFLGGILGKAASMLHKPSKSVSKVPPTTAHHQGIENGDLTDWRFLAG